MAASDRDGFLVYETVVSKARSKLGIHLGSHFADPVSGSRLVTTVSPEQRNPSGRECIMPVRNLAPKNPFLLIQHNVIRNNSANGVLIELDQPVQGLFSPRREKSSRPTTATLTDVPQAERRGEHSNRPWRKGSSAGMPRRRARRLVRAYSRGGRTRAKRS